MNKFTQREIGSQKNGDCYYYYYSECEKGKECVYRHEPSALGSETVCKYWQKGRCEKLHCSYRHMKIEKNRSAIRCYHETQPGGCTKEHCVFMHEYKNNSIHSKQNTGKTKPATKIEMIHQTNTRDQVNLKENGNVSSRNIYVKLSGEPVKNTIQNHQTITAEIVVDFLSEWKNFQSPYYVACKHLHCSVAELKEAVANKDIFFVSFTNDQLKLRPKLKICQVYGKEGCQRPQECGHFHICHRFVTDNCPEVDCILGHNWKTNHNQQILEKNFLGSLSSFSLKSLLQLNIAYENLKVCESYNESNCTRDQCGQLHLCLAYVANKCEGDSCQLNHDLEIINSILETLGINMHHTSEDLLAHIRSSMIVKAQIQRLFPSSVPPPFQDKKQSAWAFHDYGEVALSEICFDSVEGLCKFESSGCKKLHSQKHYHWQVKKNKQPWMNLLEDQVMALETAFCDPSVDGVDLPPLDAKTTHSKDLQLLLNGRTKWRAYFNSMTLGSSGISQVLMIRRLCTSKMIGASNVPSPAASLYSWYYFENRKWVEYDTVICDFVESEYEKGGRAIVFQWNKFSYRLDMLTMVEKHVQTKNKRKVKRRPRPHL